jgi:hypothetical protein
MRLVIGRRWRQGGAAARGEVSGENETGREKNRGPGCLEEA